MSSAVFWILQLTLIWTLQSLQVHHCQEELRSHRDGEGLRLPHLQWALEHIDSAGIPSKRCTSDLPDVLFSQEVIYMPCPQPLCSQRCLFDANTFVCKDTFPWFGAQGLQRNHHNALLAAQSHRWDSTSPGEPRCSPPSPCLCCSLNGFVLLKHPFSSTV